MFPKGVRSKFNDGGGFYTYIHYPGQRFAGYYTVKYEWQSRINNTANYFMTFNIKNIETLNHRNKNKERCVEKWRDHDQYVMDKMMLKVGCRPPHWNTSLNLKLCSTLEQMKDFRDQPNTPKVQVLDSPCKVIERLHYSYQERESMIGGLKVANFTRR